MRNHESVPFLYQLAWHYFFFSLSHVSTRTQQSKRKNISYLQRENPKNPNREIQQFACTSNVHKFFLPILYGFLVKMQVVIGSFMYGISKSKTKNKNREDSDIGKREDAPTGSMPTPIQHQNMISIQPNESWPGSRLLDMRTSSIDINLTRG